MRETYPLHSQVPSRVSLPRAALPSCLPLSPSPVPFSIKSVNQIKIYIAPYVHEDSEALGGWITCSRRVGIDKFLNVF